MRRAISVAQSPPDASEASIEPASGQTFGVQTQTPSGEETSVQSHQPPQGAPDPDRGQCVGRGGKVPQASWMALPAHACPDARMLGGGHRSSEQRPGSHSKLEPLHKHSPHSVCGYVQHRPDEAHATPGPTESSQTLVPPPHRARSQTLANAIAPASAALSARIKGHRLALPASRSRGPNLRRSSRRFRSRTGP